MAIERLAAKSFSDGGFDPSRELVEFLRDFIVGDSAEFLLDCIVSDSVEFLLDSVAADSVAGNSIEFLLDCIAGVVDPLGEGGLLGVLFSGCSTVSTPS